MLRPFKTGKGYVGMPKDWRYPVYGRTVTLDGMMDLCITKTV